MTTEPDIHPVAQLRALRRQESEAQLAAQALRQQGAAQREVNAAMRRIEDARCKINRAMRQLSSRNFCAAAPESLKAAIAHEPRV